MYNQVENNFRPDGANDRAVQSGEPGRLDHVDRLALMQEGSYQRSSSGGREPSSLDLNTPIGRDNGNPLGRIDANNDQMITRAESNQAYRDYAYRDGVKDIKSDEFAQLFGTGERQNQLFRAMDENGDGTVRHGEWLRHFRGQGFENYQYASNDGTPNGDNSIQSGDNSGTPGNDNPISTSIETPSAPAGAEGRKGGGGGGGHGGGNGDTPQGPIPPELMQLMQKLGLTPEEFYKKFAYADGKSGFTQEELTQAFGGDSATAQKVLGWLDTSGNGVGGHGGWKRAFKGVQIAGADGGGSGGAGGDQGGHHY